MTIRSSQMLALGRPHFAHWLLGELREKFPVHAQQLGEAGLHAWVMLGLDRATRHGFSEERDTGLYVTLMFLLARDFEQDPRFSHIAAALAPGAQAQLPPGRMDRAFASALSWLEQQQAQT